MNFSEIERIAAGIRSKIFKKSNLNTGGLFKSKKRGSGLQFREHQVYVPGDDVRFIDWKLSAKTSQTYIKTFEEEKNVDIHVLFDLSNSFELGFKGISKLKVMSDLCYLIFFVAQNYNDQVTVHIFDDEHTILKPEKGRKGAMIFKSFLEKRGYLKSLNIEKRTWKEPFEQNGKEAVIRKLLHQKKEVVFLSDFSDFNFNEEIKKYFNFPNIKSFRVISPLEELNKSPFSLRASFEGRTIFNSVFSKKEDDLDPFFKKIKKILTRDNYLKEFTKEIVR